MPNPLFQMFSGQAPAPQSMGGNPLVQRMMAVMQAMQNPAAFVKQRFPDIPQQIMNDPNQIFNYLQQTHGAVSQQQIDQAKQFGNQVIQGEGNVR